ncbi:hypothetical protein GCM10018953_40760 [Streptosporangium nondiastaticum]|uniref:protein kinase domain-containing protein n=1 Tax=Streptosporangium nondiastaticum TaxID=35764 RepID=UPI0031F7863B
MMDLIIGPYRVAGRLGQDAAGEAFLAHDPAGRQVVVKVLDPALTADPGVRWRFQQETGAASRVAPRCVVPLVSAGFDGDRAYVVTEHVEGPSLRERVEGQGPLTGPGLGSLAVSTAVALQAIHAAGVAHGRLTPSDILMSPLGPRVGGFGLSFLPRHDAPGGGTPPERVRGEAATAASDVFSWGAAVLYAATGREPYGHAGREPHGDAGDPEETARVVRPGPDLTGLTGPLRDLVASALAEDPGRRPDVRDIVRALTGVSDPAAASAPPRPPAAGAAPVPPAGGQVTAPPVIGQEPVVPSPAAAGAPAGALAEPPAAGAAPVPPTAVPEPVSPSVPGPGAAPPVPGPGAALPVPGPGAALPVPGPGAARPPVAATPGQAPPPAVPAVSGYPGAARRTDAAAVPDTARQVRRHLIPAAAGLVLAGVIAGAAWLLPRDPAPGDVASRALPTAPASVGPAPVTASPTSSPPPSPAPVRRTARPTTERALPFQDDFGGAGGWSSTAAGNAGKHRPDHGAYRLTVRAGASLPVTAPVTASLRNTVITVKGRLISGKGDFGVFCRGRKATDERYEFALTGDGGASITRSGETPSAVRRVPGLRPGRLTVLQAVCRGGATGTTLSLRVNGKEVISRVDRARPLTAGSIGVFARGRRGGSGLDVAFNSFEARP